MKKSWMFRTIKWYRVLIISCSIQTICYNYWVSVFVIIFPIQGLLHQNLSFTTSALFVSSHRAVFMFDEIFHWLIVIIFLQCISCLHSSLISTSGLLYPTLPFIVFLCLTKFLFFFNIITCILLLCRSLSLPWWWIRVFSMKRKLLCFQPLLCLHFFSWKLVIVSKMTFW